MNKVCEHTAAIYYFKYGLRISCMISTDDVFKKKLYVMATFVASSLVSYFNLLFSEYLLKIGATVLASSKAG